MKKVILVLGLTGGIGAGKSTLAQLLKLRGAVVIDADEVAREVIAPTGTVWEKLVGRFGEDILLKDKTIDRKKLGSIVFFDSEELKALNRLTHPAIREAINKRLARLKRNVPREHPPQILIVDAPLLAEAGLLPSVDMVVVVSAPEEVRLERLRKQGLTLKESKARIRSQTPEAKRQELADYILENEGTLKDLQGKANKLWRYLQKKVTSSAS